MSRNVYEPILRVCPDHVDTPTLPHVDILRVEPAHCQICNVDREYERLLSQTWPQVMGPYLLSFLLSWPMLVAVGALVALCVLLGLILTGNS